MRMRTELCLQTPLPLTRASTWISKQISENKIKHIMIKYTIKWISTINAHNNTGSIASFISTCWQYWRLSISRAWV